MRRIYFTSVTLNKLSPSANTPANFTFSDPACAAPTVFPIIPVIRDTMQPGDDAKLIVVRQQNDAHNPNFDQLQAELDALALPVELVDITCAESQDKDVLLPVYKAMIHAMEPNAAYYGCMTYGTKTFPCVLFAALAYAEKLLPHTTVEGLYYREVQWGANHEMKISRLFNTTALYHISSIVDTVSNMDCDNKLEMIDMLLDL